MDRRSFLAAASTVGVAGLTGTAVRRQIDQAAHLRPPGSRSERQFLSQCIRCHHCVTSCPVGALVILPGIGPGAAATPAIDARRQPCDLCAGQPAMHCIDACPTGALRPGTTRRQVAIGVARIDQRTCLPFQGVVCRACWRACPFAGEAIRYDALGRPYVDPRHCVGCGLCVHACLTEPASIHVEPFGSKRRLPRETPP